MRILLVFISDLSQANYKLEEYCGGMTMIFRDIVLISNPVAGLYSQKEGVETHAVPANVEQTGGLRRGGYFDSLAGDARAILDINDTWLQSIGYDVGGKFARITKHGVTKVYRITNGAIGEKFVTTGAVSHLEIDLEEVKVKNG